MTSSVNVLTLVLGSIIGQHFIDVVAGKSKYGSRFHGK